MRGNTGKLRRILGWMLLVLMVVNSAVATPLYAVAEVGTAETDQQSTVTTAPTAAVAASPAPAETGTGKSATSDVPEEEDEEEDEPIQDDGVTINYTKNASHSRAFKQGYAVVLRDTDVYKQAARIESTMKVPEGAVMVVLSRTQLIGSTDALRVTFETDEGKQEGFVAANRLRPMDQTEVSAYEKQAKADGRGEKGKHTVNGTNYILAMVKLVQDQSDVYPSASDVYDANSIIDQGDKDGTGTEDENGEGEGDGVTPDDVDPDDNNEDDAAGTPDGINIDEILKQIEEGGDMPSNDALGASIVARPNSYVIEGGEDISALTSTGGASVTLDMSNISVASKFEATLMAVPSRVLAGADVALLVSLNLRAGETLASVIEAAGIQWDASEPQPRILLENLSAIVQLPEGMNHSQLEGNSSYSAADHTVTYTFDAIDLGSKEINKTGATTLHAFGITVNSAERVNISSKLYPVTMSLYQTAPSRVLITTKHADITITASLKWEISFGRTAVKKEIDTKANPVYNGWDEQAQFTQEIYEDADTKEGKLAAKKIVDTFTIDLGEKLFFAAGLEAKDLVRFEVKTNLADNDQVVGIEMQRTSDTQVAVTITVEAMGNASITGIDILTYIKNVDVSQMIDGDVTTITQSLVSAQAYAMAGDQAPHAITETPEYHTEQMDIHAKIAESDDPVDVPITKDNLRVWITRNSDVTVPGTANTYIINYNNTSNVKNGQMENVRIRVYIPADQPFSVVPRRTSANAEFTYTKDPVQMADPETGTLRSYVYVDVVTTITSGSQQFPFELVYPIGTTSPQAAQSMVVEISQNQMDVTGQVNLDAAYAVIPAFTTRLDFGPVQPGSTMTSGTGGIYRFEDNQVPSGQFRPYEYPTNPSAAFSAIFPNAMQANNLRIDAKRFELTLAMELPEDLSPRDAEVLRKYLTEHEYAVKVDGMNDINVALTAYQVQPGSRTAEITLVVTPPDGVAKFNDISAITLEKLLPTHIDIEHFGEGVLSGELVMKLTGAKAIGADTNETSSDIDVMVSGSQLTKIVTLRKLQANANSALGLSKNTDNNIVSDESKTLSFTLSDFGTQALDENEKVFKYTLYDSWETQSTAANAEQRIVLTDIVIPPLTQKGEATDKYWYTIQYEVKGTNGGKTWQDASSQAYDGSKQTAISFGTHERNASIVGLRINIFEAAGVTSTQNVDNYVSGGMGISAPIELRYEVIVGASDPGVDATIVNSAYVKLSYADTYEKIASGNLTELESGKKSVTVTYQDNLSQPVMTGRKTFKNVTPGARNGSTTRFYPGDLVEFTITVPFSAFANGKVTIGNVNYLRLIETPGTNMGGDGVQLFPGLAKNFPAAGAATDNDISWSIGCFAGVDTDGNPVGPIATSILTDPIKYDGDKIQIDIQRDENAAQFTEDTVFQMKLQLRIGDLASLRAAYPEMDFHMYTPLQFSNSFSFAVYETDPGTDPTSNEDSISDGAGTGESNVDKVPTFGLTQTTLVYGDTDNPGAPEDTAKFRMEFVVRNVTGLQPQLAIQMPENLTFAGFDRIAHTVRANADRVTTYPNATAYEVLPNGVVLIDIPGLTVSDGDRIVIEYFGTFPDKEKVVEAIKAHNGLAEYSPTATVFISGIERLNVQPGNCAKDGNDLNDNSNREEWVLTAPSPSYAKVNLVVPGITKTAQAGSEGARTDVPAGAYLHTGDEVYYNIALTSHEANGANSDMLVYALYDILPDGFSLKQGSSITVDGKTGVTSMNSEGVVTFNQDGKPYLTVPLGQTVNIGYTVVVGENLLIGDDAYITAKNTAHAYLKSSDYDQCTFSMLGEGYYRTAITDGYAGGNIEISADIEHRLTRAGIKPGLTKTMGNPEDLVMPEDIVTITLTFENGSHAGKNNQPSIMENPTLVDVLPEGWKLAPQSNFKITRLTPMTAEDQEKDLVLRLANTDDKTNALTITTLGKVMPGARYAVSFDVVTPAGIYKRAYNEAYLIPGEAFAEADIIAGEPAAYETKNAVKATAELDVTGGMMLDVVKGVNAPKGSDTWAYGNNGSLVAVRDMEVAYTLSFRNKHEGAIGYTFENICLIDRLPGVGDTSLVHGKVRGSQWALKDVTVRLTDLGGAGTSDVRVQYASITRELNEGDWSGGNSSDWHNTWREGDTMVRIVFPQTFKLAAGKSIEVVVEGKVPNTVEEAQLAVNSFSYRATANNITDGSSLDLLDDSNQVVLEARRNAISGFIWYDENGNNIYDTGEKKMPAGMKVYLYEEPAVGTNPGTVSPLRETTTDSEGFYIFEEVLPGTYYVAISTHDLLGRSEYKAYWSAKYKASGNDAVNSVFITEAKSGSKPITLERPILVSPSLIILNKSIEHVNAGLVAKPAEIGDYVWHNTSGSGYQMEDEPGVEGVKVTLYEVNADGRLSIATDESGKAFTMETDADGLYLFTGMKVGKEYCVGFELWQDAGMDFTQQKPIAIINSVVSRTTYSASGVLTGYTDVFEVKDDYTVASNRHVDAGLITAPPYRIEGFVFGDTNYDGIWDDENEASLGDAGVQVTITQVDGSMNPVQGGYSKQVPVDENGFFCATDVAPGYDYLITFTRGNGQNWIYTTGEHADGNFANVYTFAADTIRYNFGVAQGKTDATAKTPRVIRLSNDTRVARVDVGIYDGATVRGTVWMDTDRDAVIAQTGERGIEGIPVKLRSGSLVVAETETDADGKYVFEHVPVGADYSVLLDVPEALTVTTGKQGYQPDTVAKGTEAKNHADSQGFVKAFTVNEVDGEYVANMGVFAPLDIVGKVWHDKSRDGVIDEGEGMLYWSNVYLMTAADVTRWEAAGSAERIAMLSGLRRTEAALYTGEYKFEDIAPNSDYRVMIITSYACSLPESANHQAITANNQEMIAVFHEVSVGETGTGESYDFGLYKPVNVTGVVFEDANYNGVLDNGEKVLAGVKVELIQNNVVIRTTYTDAEGKYIFEDVPAGSYRVYVDKTANAAQPYSRAAMTASGTQITYPEYTKPGESGSGSVVSEVDNNGNGLDDIIVDDDLTSENVIKGTDAGLTDYVTLHVHAWRDVVNENKKDSDEQAIQAAWSLNDMVVKVERLETTNDGRTKATLVETVTKLADKTDAHAAVKVLPGTYQVTYEMGEGAPAAWQFRAANADPGNTEAYGAIQTVSGNNQTATSYPISLQLDTQYITGMNEGYRYAPVFYLQSVLSDVRKMYQDNATLLGSMDMGTATWKTNEETQYYKLGDTISYAIRVSNIDTAGITVKIVDKLDAHHIYKGNVRYGAVGNLAAVPAGNVNFDTATNTLTVIGLEIGGATPGTPTNIAMERWLVFEAQVAGLADGEVAENGRITIPNTADVYVGTDLTSTNNVTYNDPPDTTNETIVRVAEPEVKLEKTLVGTNTWFHQGDEVTFEVKLTINPPAGTTLEAYTGLGKTVSVSDTLPAGLTYISSTRTDSNGSGLVVTASQNGTDLPIWGVETAPAGTGPKGVYTWQVKARVDAPDTSASGFNGIWNMTNVATATYTRTNEKLEEKSVTLTDDAQVNASRLSLEKQVSKSTVRVGEAFQYTIVVKNPGQIPETFAFEDVIDADLQVDSTKLPTGMTAAVQADGTTKVTVNSVTVPAATGTTPGQTTITIPVIAKMKQNPPANMQWTIPNAATITIGASGAPGRYQVDSNTVNVTVNEGYSAEIVKTVRGGNGPYQTGTTVYFDIKVTNTGTMTLTNLDIVDQLSGVTLLERPSGSTLIEGGRGVRIASLAPGASVSIVAQYTIGTAQSGSIRNIATVTNNEVDEEDEQTITVVSRPSVKVTKTADRAGGYYRPGDTVTYTIVVTNDGNVAMKDIGVNDPMSGGTFVLNSTNTNVVRVSNNEVKILALSVGQTETLTFTYVIPANTANGTALKNSVTVTGTGNNGGGGDDDDGGNKVTDDDDTNIIISKELSLEVEKTVEKTMYARGETAKFNIAVRNTGHYPIYNITVEDKLAGGKFVLPSTAASSGITVTAAGNVHITMLGVGQVVNLPYHYVIPSSATVGADIVNAAVATGYDDANNPVNSATDTDDTSTRVYSSTSSPSTGDETPWGWIIGGLGGAALLIVVAVVGIRRSRKRKD